MDKQKEYFNFDLQLETIGQGYQARVLQSPAGEATGTFKLPFTPIQLEALLSQLNQARHIDNLENQTKEVDATRELGWKLFNAVFGRDLEFCLRQSLTEADNQKAGLRLRLITNQTKLADLPWEYLFYPAFNSFLGLSDNVNLVRFQKIDVGTQSAPPSVTLPLKILALISNPGDYTQFDAEVEWRYLQDTLSKLEQRELVKIDRLVVTNLTELRQKLKEDTYHVLHFVGHGVFDWQNNGLMVLTDANGQGSPVDGQAMATLLQEFESLRLVFFSSWEGLRTGGSEPFNSLAQTLVRHSFPAVVANQFEISDEAASVLISEMYTQLALGQPVDTALSIARQSLFGKGNQTEWGTLLLCTNVEDGRIFELEPLSQLPQKQLYLDTLYSQAQVAFANQDWSGAEQKLKPILELNPNYPQAFDLLTQVQHQIELARLYDIGLQQYNAGQWHESLDSLRQVQQQAADFKDVAQLITNAEAQLTLSKKQNIIVLYKEAETAREQGDWSLAINRLEAILALDETETATQSKLNEVKQEQSLEALYSSGQGQYQEGHWQEALESFQKLQTLSPDYKNVQTLIQEIQARLQPSPVSPAANASIAAIFNPIASYASQSPDVLPPAVQPVTEQPTTPILGGTIDQSLQVYQPQQEWDTLYAVGIHHYDRQNWQEAFNCFNQLQHIAGNYRDTARLAADCEAHLTKPAPLVVQSIPYIPAAIPGTVVQPQATTIQPPLAPVVPQDKHLPPPFVISKQRGPRDWATFWLTMIIILWTLVPIILLVLLLARH